MKNGMHAGHMLKINKKQKQTHWIPIGKLSVKFARAQRALSEANVQEIAEQLDLDLLGTIQVSLPDSKGVHHIIDGQTRVAAMRRYGFDESTTVQCEVHPYSDAVNCARLFRLFNNKRRAIKAVDDYIAGVTGEFEEHVAVDRIVRGVGFEIAAHSGDGIIHCPNACLGSYRRHGGAPLRKGLETIKATWGEDPNGLIGPIISGYAMLVNAHDDQLDYARLVDRVEKKFTPGRLRGTARSHREVNGGSDAIAVYKVVLDTYNASLRNKLKAKV